MSFDPTLLLKEEIRTPAKGMHAAHYFRAIGYRAAEGRPLDIRRAAGVASLLAESPAHIYRNDLIVGSMRSLFAEITEAESQAAAEACAPYPQRWFGTNSDHYSADYVTPLRIGIPGLIAKIDASIADHADEPDRVTYLEGMRMTLEALKTRLTKHADLAATLHGTEGYDDAVLASIEANCRALTTRPPETFHEALQLVWMIHSSFNFEGRYAMALGRIDQYLHPFYLHDLAAGTITEEDATALFGNIFVKICEWRALFGGDDVVNIAIGGSDRYGNCMVNRLSYCALWAVRNVNQPGPNLSARLCATVPDEFLDECLKVIGTGLGYPALMNDAVNIPALLRYGYDETDVYDYTMVGCIENFVTGCQPPWTDGRFDTPRFFEYIFNRGKGYFSPVDGIDTGDVSEITSMDEFMKRLEAQLTVGAEAYVNGFYGYNTIPDPENYTSPFLSCFCKDCIARGKDINMGGARYPSVHGAALMGVGTMCDSLAAIERVVFIDKEATLTEIGNALKANFEGYEELRQKLLAAPKYGNNDELADKYSVWFVNFLMGEFDKYRTKDGGGIYGAMAANVANIYAGHGIGATPDGRRAGEPLSDAASPTYGRDTRGATTTVLSVTKPDYSKIACGTVINQKFSPSMFEDGKRQKLVSLLKVYFARGGQEMQINATSPEILRDALDHPEKYPDLVVRVSGFSAYYITLQRDVQLDILARTQQE